MPGWTDTPAIAVEGEEAGFVFLRREGVARLDAAVGGSCTDSDLKPGSFSECIHYQSSRSRQYSPSSSESGLPASEDEVRRRGAGLPLCDVVSLSDTLRFLLALAM